MKKLFSLLAVAVLGFTACQTDEGVKNATLENEGVVSLNVSIPELATRVLDGDNQNGADSAYGAIDYANYTEFLEKEYDVRFQLAVYEAGAAEDAEPIYTATEYVDFASTANFYDLRFVPGRKYQFVFFADFVPQGTKEDYRYNTADLRNITSFEPLNAMDETYDAYFHNETVTVEAGKVNELEIPLKRPFGKIRVLTTDLAFVEKYAMPAEGEVTFYNHAIYKSFNAVTGEVATEATNAEETISYAIDRAYYGATEYNNAPACTLFATYILGKTAQESVNFRLDTFEADGSLIKSLDFNTEIPYQRNHLTTLVGNLLTNETDLFVRIDDNFAAEAFQNEKWDNVETGLEWVREGESVGGSQVYAYETNLFTFWLLREPNGTALREGTYEYTKELAYIQNATGFDIKGIDVEKGTLNIKDLGTRAGNTYEVVFDIYATIDGKTENYILTWTGELKAAREALAEPVVTYEVDEVDALYITFSWEAVENAANYTVKWNDEEQTVEGTSATFDFSGEDTYATAYVTANPANADDYTASTVSVTVNWKKPIEYQTIRIELAGIDKDGAHFYSIEKGLDLTIYVPNYPDLKDAWYWHQVPGNIPTPFSAEAKPEVTTGSAAGYVIYEPNAADLDQNPETPDAYKFTYVGSMEPIVLTQYEYKWVAGYNTDNNVEVLFSNENGDAIKFQTADPMEAGHATIEPSYVAIDGQQAGNITTAEMNVLLEDGKYTVFFKIKSATNQVLMQYVGEINFEKPYAPQYVLESYTAGPETIYFEGENAKFEIEATSLESGDVAVKMLSLDGSDDYAASNQVTAATAVVTEENGVYDARYTVTVNLPIVGAKTFDLQYVGPFVPYSAPVEPEKPIEFKATYEIKAGAYIFTGVNYNFTILVNNLATTQYISGETEDAWAYDWTLGQSMNNFRTGDFLTVENNVVTVEFTAAPLGEELRYKMTCDMNPAVQEPENIYLSATVDGTVYTAVEDDYMIDYTDGYANAYYQGKLMGGVTVDVADGADDIEFTFFHEERNAYIHITYDKIGVTPAQELKIDLQFDGTIYTYTFENGYKYVFDTVEGKVGYIAPNALVPEATFDYTLVESATVDTYTFEDTLNGYNVIATYKKGETLVADLELKSWKQGADVGERGILFNAYVENMDDNYVTVIVNSVDATGNSLAEGVYTHNYNDPEKAPGMFTLSAYKLNGARVTRNNIGEAQMIVVKNGENYDITIVAGEFVAHYFGTVGEATVTPDPEQPDPEQPVDWTNLSETAELGKVGVFPAYVSDNYHIIGETWTERANDKNYGTCEIVETANGYIFTFDDEKNFRHVTITYKEAGSQPEGPVTIDPWACTASNVSGNPLTGYSVTLTGENGDVIVLTGVKFNSWGASSATLNNNAVEFTGNGAMIDTNNGGYVKVDITIGNTTYKGTSKNAVA